MQALVREAGSLDQGGGSWDGGMGVDGRAFGEVQSPGLGVCVFLDR